MDLRCPHCAPIWREYARATDALFRLGASLPLATLAGDVEEAGRIRVSIARERRSCGRLRELLSEHEAQLHAGVTEGR